jgi:S-adenosylmethionine synthetase
LSHQRGKKQKKKRKEKTNKQTNKKHHKMSQVQMQYSFSFSACRCSSVVVSSKEEGKSKRVWRQFCEWYLRMQLTCPLLSA